MPDNDSPIPRAQLHKPIPEDRLANHILNIDNKNGLDANFLFFFNTVITVVYGKLDYLG